MSRNNLRALVGNVHDRVVSNWGYNSAGIKTIQPGVIDLNGVTTLTATITAVNLSNAFALYLGLTSGGTDTLQNIACDVVLTNSTTVTATRGGTTAQPIPVRFVVLEFQPGVIKSIQAGSTTGGVTTATITAVQTTKALVFPMGFSTSSAAATSMQWVPAWVLTNATTVTVAASAGILNPGTYRFVVVEFY